MMDQSQMARPAHRERLSTGWTFQQTDSVDDWLPVASVPSVSHLDLIDNGRISDPFKAMNELQVEWVGEKSWTYRKSFTYPVLAGESVHLIFEGLDTFATVKLNGTTLFTSDNMFLSHRVNVTELLQPSNTLVIDFESALLRARQLEKNHPEHRFIAHNGEVGRIGVRKAQYHWGWDWGPILMTAGPWRPISIEIATASIQDISIKYQISPDLGAISGTVRVEFEGQVDAIRLTIAFKDSVITETTVSHDSSVISFAISEPSLWYPVGYGDQDLYDLTVELVKDQFTIDKMTKRTGFRLVQLVQDEDANGESFYFRINNIDVFAGGSCWIPPDSFLPRTSREKYRDWAKLVCQCNQVMIRVWGGGVYEDDSFYDACDEFGILVWQDFMFACGSYPTWESLRESIGEEAKQNVKRLRHHPCMALYCGNNEDYQTQEYYKLDYDWEDKQPESWLKGTFPARYYYEHLLPKVVADESPDVPYWPSSPFSSKGREANDKKAGDIHQWNMWHGYQEKYQAFDKNGGRFVSEFGLQGLPQLATVKDFVSSQDELYPGSQALNFHNKAHGHERRIATYIVDNFRPLADLEGHIYLSQLMQSEALTFAYKGWRRQWGQGRLCGGALVWQLNDCWPCTSWAIADYYLRKKPAFYAIARQMQPITVCVQREHHDWSGGHDRPKKTKFDVWVASRECSQVCGEVEIRFISIRTGSQIKPAVYKSVPIVNGTTAVMSGEVDEGEAHVIAVRLFMGGEIIGRDVDWPQPLKYLSFHDRGVDVQVSSAGYTITCHRPTKGLVFEETDGVTLSDNAIDVVPGDTQVIKVSEQKVPRYRYLE
ncbi:glycoside hydrolase superfamily [Stachybotrys elegans]|uniref:Beta-mannosidase B n=1 Tax=Stachybotrys elegans TaxID=80388 RepID=A0A8K0SKN6_9HYPO|nr:glycoside hydrolase superfamily [Stachybotrys elegans]